MYFASTLNTSTTSWGAMWKYMFRRPHLVVSFGAHWLFLGMLHVHLLHILVILRTSSRSPFYHFFSKLTSPCLNSYFSYGNPLVSLFCISVALPCQLYYFSDEEISITYWRFQNSTNLYNHIVTPELCKLHNKAVQHHFPWCAPFSW